MNIKASCTFDYESIRAFVHFTMFKKAEPKKRILIWSIVYTVLTLVIAVEMLLFGGDLVLIGLLGVCLLILFYGFFAYFILPKIRYKALGKIKGTVNNYIFSDDSLTVMSQSDEFNGESSFKYSMFTRVWETSRYLFMFQNNSQAFLIDKTTVTDGSFDDIKTKLSEFPNIKYIVCKY